MENEATKQQYKQRIKNAIDFALMRKSSHSIKGLDKEQIRMVLRQSKDGFLYEITYVDFKHKCVFKGSDLGKEYSAKGIQQRCNVEVKNIPAQNEKLLQQNLPNEPEINISATSSAANILGELIKPELEPNANEPFEIKKFKKRKKLLKQKL